MSTAVDNRAAIVALLTAANANPKTLQELSDSPSLLPDFYCEVYVTERVTDPETDRYGSRTPKGFWRVQVRAVAKRENNAEEVRRRVRDALEDHTVTVSGVQSTPMLRGASDDPIAPDDGWWSGLSEYTYTL